MRFAIRIAAAMLATLACAACGATTDEDLVHRLRESPSLSRSEIEAEFPSAGSEDLLNVPKISHGTEIDFDDGLGRATVQLQGGCTGQVINRWFILTAAHCMAGVLPIGVGNIEVKFTRSSGPAEVVYSGYALGWGESNWELNWKDAAMIFLVDGMDTCHGDEWACGDVAIPNNAVFQWFNPGSTMFLQPQYFIVGYGTTDDTNGFGTLRYGRMSRSTSIYTSDNRGLTHVMSWSNQEQARPCPGDSGSALVTPFSRLLHTGIASGGDSCQPDAAIVTYSGLTFSQLQFVASFMVDMRNEFGLPFGCTVSFNSSNGLGVLHCDNDHSLYR